MTAPVGQGAEAAWVWNGHDLSDEEWIKRLRSKEVFQPRLRALRVIPPEAFVTVIEPSRAG